MQGPRDGCGPLPAPRGGRPPGPLSLLDWLGRRLPGSSCLLFTPATHTGLPLLLHAVDHYGLEVQFYRLVSAFTDLHAGALELQVSKRGCMFRL